MREPLSGGVLARVSLNSLTRVPILPPDPVPKPQTGVCALIAQLRYKIFIEPAQCCVAACPASTAGHPLLSDPGGGRPGPGVVDHGDSLGGRDAEDGNNVARFLRLQLTSRPRPSRHHVVVVSALRPDSFLQASLGGGGVGQPASLGSRAPDSTPPIRQSPTGSLCLDFQQLRQLEQIDFGFLI